MPLPSGNSLRYIRPVVFSSPVVANSTENTCTPALVTISSGSILAARALEVANAQSAMIAAARARESRARAKKGLTPEFITNAYPARRDFCKDLFRQSAIQVFAASNVLINGLLNGCAYSQDRSRLSV